MTKIKLDEFTRQYLETALWSSTDSEDLPLDANFSIDDIERESIEKAVTDCEKFQQQNLKTLEAYESSTAGHDFWLTRNHHGAGFWDGDYEKNDGKILTKDAREFGELNLIQGDDGKLYLE